MNVEIKAQWLAALRSGEYEQGQNLLQPAKGRFCCLGVLCDLAAKEGIGHWAGGVFFDNDKIEHNHNVLPVFVARWSGLDFQNPMIDHDNQHRLSDYNDGTGGLDPLSFTELADLIEAAL